MSRFYSQNVTETIVKNMGASNPHLERFLRSLPLEDVEQISSSIQSGLHQTMVRYDVRFVVAIGDLTQEILKTTLNAQTRKEPEEIFIFPEGTDILPNEKDPKGVKKDNIKQEANNYYDQIWGF